MPRVHMTDVVVSRLKEPGTYFDQTTPAFGLRVGKNRKTFFVIRGRERLRTNVGKYPAVSLADARKEAKRLLTEELDQGRPNDLRCSLGPLQAHAGDEKTATKRDYIRVIEKHLKPTEAQPDRVRGHHGHYGQAACGGATQHPSRRQNPLPLVR